MSVISKLFNQKGSATMVAMMGMGLLALSVSSSMLINNQMISSAKIARANENASSLVQTLMVMFSDSEMCLKGAGSNSPGNGSNLRFLNNAGGGNGFNNTLADSTLGQRIRVRSSYFDPSDANGLFLTDGAEIQELGLRVDSLRFKLTSTNGNERRGEIYIAVSTLTEPSTSLSRRKVADVKVILSGAQVDSCVALDTAMSAETICADMGCNFDPTDVDGNGQICDCPLPEISCTDTSNGYIKGMTIDSAGVIQPLCGQALFECPADFNFLEGFNFTGSKLCAQVNVALENGLCGPANGGTYDDAAMVNFAGLCSAGQENPSPLPAASGPWAWTCDGINGGTTDSCSADQTPPPISGFCGSAHGNNYATAADVNAAGLCASGITNPSSGVSGAGPWSWSCDESGGGTTVNCAAGVLGGGTSACTLAGSDNSGWTIWQSCDQASVRENAADVLGIDPYCDASANIGVYSPVGACIYDAYGVFDPSSGHYDCEFDYYTCAGCPAGTSTTGAGSVHPTESSCSCINADETWNSTSGACEPPPVANVCDGTSPAWTATNMTNAPDDRLQAIFEQAAGKILMFGGYHFGIPGTVYNGKLLNPDNTWSNIAAYPGPTTDRHVGVASYGDEVFAIMGAGSVPGQLYSYNAATDTWSGKSTTNMPTYRNIPLGLLSSQYYFYFRGGAAKLYNRATNTWTDTAVAPIVDRYSAHGFVYNNKFYVWGGKFDSSTELTDGAYYDPATNTWTMMAPLPYPIYHFSTFGQCTAWSGTKMFQYSNDGSTNMSAGTYDPATDTWTQASLPTGTNDIRNLYSGINKCEWVGSEFMVYATSSRKCSAVKPWFFPWGKLYDPATDSWRDMNTHPDPSRVNQNIEVLNGKAYIWGGTNSQSALDGPQVGVNDGWIYDPAIDP